MMESSEVQVFEKYMQHQAGYIIYNTYMAIYLYTPLVDVGCFFSFLIHTQLVGLLGMRYQPLARPLPTHRTTQTQNKRAQTSMPRVGFKTFFNSSKKNSFGRAANKKI
jgi:hypothetical protein